MPSDIRPMKPTAIRVGCQENRDPAVSVALDWGQILPFCKIVYIPVPKRYSSYAGGRLPYCLFLQIRGVKLKIQ